MELGWMRARSPLSWEETLSIVAQADEVGLRQIHLPTLNFGSLARLPRTMQVMVGVDASTLPAQSPRNMAERLQDACRFRDGQLVLTVSPSASPATWTANQTLETLLSDGSERPLKTDLPIDPRPEVLALPSSTYPMDMRNAAGNGFHVMSPAWSSWSSITRHWTEIVLGATHAVRRACLSHWHVARYVFVSDDRAELAAYRANIANLFPHHRLDDVTIAGSAETVAQDIRKLRRRVGKFGVLQIIDPGFDLVMGRRQRERLVRQVLPMIAEHTSATGQVVEPT
ncbi:MAG: hypothetical protein AAFQ66_15840 [Pseudomonadota bacterium]